MVHPQGQRHGSSSDAFSNRRPHMGHVRCQVMRPPEAYQLRRDETTNFQRASVVAVNTPVVRFGNATFATDV